MTTPTQLPSEASSALAELRSRIRSYVFWEGLALVVVVLGAIFWISFAFDWFYFRVSRLELPRWFRAAVLVGGIGLVAARAFASIALRMFRGLRTKSLAIILERKFPELDDRLLIAVDAAEGLVESDSPVTSAMLQRTLADVARTIKQLDLSSVFDSQPLRKASSLAVGLVATILGLMVVDSPAMERWVAGYLELRDGYWTRETELVVRIVVQPGDQLRDFIDGHYRHPKGGDLSLVIQIPENKVAPERIRLDSRMGHGLNQLYLTPSSDGTFRHTFVGLIEDVRIWVSGGDFSHAQPYSVEVVPPPEVKQIVLHSLYPAYTGLNQQTPKGTVRTSVELKGSQVSLPMQTDFSMEIVSNKPLHKARLEGDAGLERWEIELNSESSGNTSAKIVLKSQDGKPQIEIPLPELAASAFNKSTKDGQTSFSLPFVLVADGATVLPELLHKAAEMGQPLPAPLPLPPDSLLRLSLEDKDLIASPIPTRFTIHAIVDEPPLVETRLKGIGTSVTRKARIPIAGNIVDDYGVAMARFEYKVDEATEWQPRVLASPPKELPRDFTLQRNDKEAFERFDVLPLDLSVKQRLTVTVAAVDSCTVPSGSTASQTAPTNRASDWPDANPNAHRSQGLKFVFTIISEEELLSMLYGRELGLRKRMEQIVSESKSTLKEMQSQHDKLSEWNQFKAANVAAEDERIKTIIQGMNATADRSLHAVRKNSVEAAGVELAFAEIREELINNSADTLDNLERLDVKILAPLNRINSKIYPGVDGALGLLKLALEKNTDPKDPLEKSIDETTTLIKSLEAVLAEMAELARFDELLEELKKTIKAESDLLEQTKRKRKEKAIKDLE